MIQQTTRAIHMFAVVDGDNAVGYDFVFGSESYARVVAGRLSCHLSCQVWRVEGDARESFEDIDPTMPRDRDWTVVVEVGTKSSPSTGTLEIDHDSFEYSLSEADYAEVGRPTMLTVSLRADGRWYGQTQFPVTVHGADGHDVVSCDFADEQWLVPCDSDGDAIGTFPAWTTRGHLWLGGNRLALDLTRCSVSQEPSAGLVVPVMTLEDDDETAVVRVTGFGSGSGEVNMLTVTLADVEGHTSSQVLKVLKTTLPCVYQLRPSTDVIKVDKSGVRTPDGFLQVGAVKMSGGMVTDVDMLAEGSPVVAKYSKDGGQSWQNCGRQQVDGGFRQNYGVNLTGSEGEVRLRLVGSSGFVYDEETVPVVSDGADGQVFFLTTNIKSVAADKDGHPLAATEVKIRVMKRVGTSSEQVGADTVYCVWRSFLNGSQRVRGRGWWGGLDYTIQTSEQADSHQFEIWSGEDLSTATMLCEPLSIPFERQGAQGDRGERGFEGLIIRVSEWETGKDYRNDENVTDEQQLGHDGRRYLDIVSVTDGAAAVWYKAEEAHNGKSSGANTKPGSSTSASALWRTYWREFDVQGVPVMTPLLYAQKALIEYLQASQIVLRSLDGTNRVLGAIGYADGDDGGDMAYPLWLGGETPTSPETKFYVDMYGRMFCMGADIHGNVTIKDDDGLTVYDSNGDERIRISAQNIDKPSTDESHVVDIRNGNAYLGTDNDIDCVNGRMTVDETGRSDFAMGSGQHVSGTLRFSLSDGNGVFGTVGGIHPPVLTIGISLIDTSTGLVVADDIIVRELGSGDLLANMDVGDVGNMNVGQYMCTRSMTCALLVSVVMTNVTSGNFSLYEKASSDGVLCRLEVTGMEVSAKASVTLLGPNGLCVNAGANRHILMDGDGIVLRWGRAGLRLSGNKGAEVMERLLADGLTWVPMNAMKVRTVNGISCTVQKDDDYIIWNQSGNGTLFFAADAGYNGHRVTIKPNQRNIAFNSENVCGWSDAIGDYTGSYNGSRPFALTYYNGWWYAEKLGD